MTTSPNTPLQPFEINQTYIRRSIHEHYGGQQQGGISTPAQYPVIFLFTGESGREHGYGYDYWVDSQYFDYTGEGQPDKGDMEFKRGNLAIRNHLKHNKRIFLFEKAPGDAGKVIFVAELQYVSHRTEQRDTTGIPRKVIIFRFQQIS